MQGGPQIEDRGPPVSFGPAGRRPRATRFDPTMAQVNPKDMKPQVYKDPRPPEMFSQYHRSARRGVGWIYDFVRAILTIPTILLYRARAIGVENVPTSGPVVL